MINTIEELKDLIKFAKDNQVTRVKLGELEFDLLQVHVMEDGKHQASSVTPTQDSNTNEPLSYEQEMWGDSEEGEL